MILKTNLAKRSFATGVGFNVDEQALSINFTGMDSVITAIAVFDKKWQSFLVGGCIGVYLVRGLFAVLIGLLSFNTYAADCFERAGRDYRIDPDLLRAISWNESNGNIHAIGKNPDNSLDIGLMQINTQHEPELKRYGITRHHLTADPCMNIYTGAYYLAIAFRHWGVNWDAVGAYNAGFAKNIKQDKRRKHYARKIYTTYRAIKAQKKAAH